MSDIKSEEQKGETHAPHPRERYGVRDMELLGQGFNYPQNLFETIAFVVIVLGLTGSIVGSIALLKQYTPDQIDTFRSIWSGQVASVRKVADTVEGKIVLKTSKGFSIGFWTPSKKTADGMKDYINDPEYKWQIDSPSNNIEKKNEEFGAIIKGDSQISGYRRYEVLGVGKTGLKTGWWWIVTIDGQYSDDFTKWFAGKYKSFWGVPASYSILVEVTGVTPEKPM